MLKDQIIISKVTADDLDTLRNLSIKTFYESFIWGNTEENIRHYIDNFFPAEKLASEIATPSSEFYFAMMNGNAIGYLKINFGNAQTELQDNNGLEIERIYVKKEAQGKRIGQLLFDQAITIANNKNLDYLWLGVWEKNPGAIKFYERNGLVQFATHPFRLGDDLQTDIMMKLDFKNRHV